MRRQPARVPDPAPPVVHVIDAQAVYTADGFRRVFGLRASSLRREVREGRLIVHRRCGRYFILGLDVLAWLRAGEVRPRARTAAPAANGDMDNET
jgi:hypothetical protein